MSWTETYHCDVCGKSKTETETDWWLAWTESEKPFGAACSKAHSLEPASFSQCRCQAPVRSAVRADADGSLDGTARVDVIGNFQPPDATKAANPARYG